MTRTIGDFTIWTKGGDHLLGISVEGEDAQRNAVIKQAEASANRRLLICKRCPRKPNAWRYASRIGDPLPLEPSADIHRKPRSDDPMVLGEECGLKIGALDGLPSDPVNSLYQPPLGIFDQHRPSFEFTPIAGSRHGRAELQIVRAIGNDR